jgi:hypothetical protein
MRCVQCGRDAKKKDRVASQNFCPSCRHPFVTVPESDRITDMFVKKAEDAVSGNGTFYYLPAHLKYEITRRLLKKSRRLRLFGLGWFVVMLLSLPLAALDVRFLFLSSLFLIFSIFFLFSSDNSGFILHRLDALLQKWEQANPNDHLLTGGSPRSRASEATTQPDLSDVSFDRVLICDRDEYVDFFLANLFHFHYSCPVLGGSGYPADVCSDMLRRLKANPNVEVYLVHDFTSAGYQFVRDITTSQAWFGNGEAAATIDLGLTEEQKPLFSALQVPSNETNAYAQQSQQAELTVLRPEMLIRMCGLCLSEQVPFHLLPNNTVADHGGYG